MDKVANLPNGGMTKSAVMTEEEYSGDETITGRVLEQARTQSRQDGNYNIPDGDDPDLSCGGA